MLLPQFLPVSYFSPPSWIASEAGYNPRDGLPFAVLCRGCIYRDPDNRAYDEYASVMLFRDGTACEAQTSLSDAEDLMQDAEAAEVWTVVHWGMLALARIALGHQIKRANPRANIALHELNNGLEEGALDAWNTFRAGLSDIHGSPVSKTAAKAKTELDNPKILAFRRRPAHTHGCAKIDQ